MNPTFSTLKFNSYTPIGKQQEKKLAQILNNLIDLPEATDFLHPVAWKELQLDDYLDVIRYPMNLYKVQQKFKARQFTTVQQVLDLIQLIWDNCKQYNKEGHYFELAQKMQKHLKKMIKNYLPSVVYTIVQPRAYSVQSTYKRQSPKQIQSVISRTQQHKSYSKAALYQRSASLAQPQQQQPESQKVDSQQQPEIQQIPFTEKNRFHQRLKQITQQDLAQIVMMIQEYSSDAFKHISGPRYQIHVDNIDMETFKKVSQKLDQLIENEKISNGHPMKKIKA